MFVSSRLLRTPNAAIQKGFITGDSMSHCCVARRLVLKMHALFQCNIALVKSIFKLYK